MSRKGNAPIVIKRRRVVKAEEHHGGAWKIAYADFVTAMMAFFMLMWLLNATSEKQRLGLAQYFNPEIPMNRLGSSDSSLLGEGSVGNDTSTDKAADGSASGEASDEAKAQKELEARLRAIGGESMETMQLLKHVVSRISDEGLVIEVFDLPDSPLFVGDTTQPTQTLIDLSRTLLPAIKHLPNKIGINSHVREHPITLIENPVWEMSSDRGQVMRNLMEKAGLKPKRIQRVVGYADRRPSTDNTMEVRNNRLELVLLKRVTRW